MKCIIKECNWCNKKFNTPLKEINRGNGKFCSRNCSLAKGRSTKIIKPKIKVICAYCKKETLKRKKDLRNSKSGLYFCNREHKELAQRIGGIKEIQPDHYKDLNTNYRIVAFRVYEKKCYDCGYNKYPQILEVHHLDENRSNNKIENLKVVCPNCHTIRHRGLGTA